MKPTGFDSSVQVNRAQICCYAVEILWNFFASIGGWVRFGRLYPRGVFLGLLGTFRFGQYPLGAWILHSNLSNLSWVGIVRAYLILNRHFPHSLRFSCHLSLGRHFAQMTFRNCLWSFRDQDRGHRNSARRRKKVFECRRRIFTFGYCVPLLSFRPILYMMTAHNCFLVIFKR